MIIRTKIFCLFLWICWFAIAPLIASTDIQIITLDYGPDDQNQLDLYTAVPLPEDPMPTLVLAHGGLWQGGDRSELETLCRNIVTRSDGVIACASIDYRLSDSLGGSCTGTGTDTYTEQLSDLALAYSYLQHEADSLRIDPGRIHIGGHSAGAHLAQTLNLRWSEFIPACTRSDACPAASGAIGTEGIYDIPGWDEYEAVRWQSAFECATRKAFGAPGDSPAACVDESTGERCWDAGSPLFLAERAEELGILPAGDVFVVHSPGDDWGDIADSDNFANAVSDAFPELVVVSDTQGACAVSQHNLVLREESLADCIISFVTERTIPNATAGFFTAAMNDAWFNPTTPGQGFFITVFPDLEQVFLAWFTYDTELPPEDVTALLGDPGHRWLTAFGSFERDRAILDIFITEGGLFNDPTEVQQTDPPGADGTVRLVFDGCNSGTIEYDIPSIDRQGLIPIQRIATDNVARCEDTQ